MVSRGGGGERVRDGGEQRAAGDNSEVEGGGQANRLHIQ